MPGSASVFGCKHVFLLALFLVPFSLTCKSRPVVEEAAQTDEFEQDVIVTRDAYVEEEKKTKLPHPKRANANVTRFLVMTTNLPPRDRLDQCRQEIISLGANALNSETMVVTQKKVAEVVRQALPLYHWCFYDAMVILDNKLENDGLGTRLEEVVVNFSKNMKGLWILSLALDEVATGHRYFDYLRARYVQLSRDYFARDTVIIAPPFGFGGKKVKPLPEKPIGAADVDL